PVIEGSVTEALDEVEVVDGVAQVLDGVPPGVGDGGGVRLGGAVPGVGGVVDGAVAGADVEFVGALEGAGEPALRFADGRRRVAEPRPQRRDGGGQRATGAVGGGGVDAWGGEVGGAAVGVDEDVGDAAGVEGTALGLHLHLVFGGDGARLSDGVGHGGGGFGAGEGRQFRDVRRDQVD